MTFPPVGTALVRTGKFCSSFAPVSASPASFAVTPSSPRSMPSPPFALEAVAEDPVLDGALVDDLDARVPVEGDAVALAGRDAADRVAVGRHDPHAPTAVPQRRPGRVDADEVAAHDVAVAPGNSITTPWPLPEITFPFSAPAAPTTVLCPRSIVIPAEPVAEIARPARPGADPVARRWSCRSTPGWMLMPLFVVGGDRALRRSCCRPRSPRCRRCRSRAGRRRPGRGRRCCRGRCCACR